MRYPVLKNIPFFPRMKQNLNSVLFLIHSVHSHLLPNFQLYIAGSNGMESPCGSNLSSGAGAGIGAKMLQSADLKSKPNHCGNDQRNFTKVNHFTCILFYF